MFGDKPTNHMIDGWTAEAIERQIGNAMSSGNVDANEFSSLLHEMERYRDVWDLGMWKTSRMVSVLERFLSKAPLDRGKRKRLLAQAREALF